MRVMAMIWSDDHLFEAHIDIEQWLKQATDKEIIDVIESGFGHDYYPVDEIAHYMADYNEEISKMFQYLELIRDRKDIGFDVEVNEIEMVTWLNKFKPEIYKEYQKYQEEEKLKKEMLEAKKCLTKKMHKLIDYMTWGQMRDTLKYLWDMTHMSDGSPVMLVFGEKEDCFSHCFADALEASGVELEEVEEVRK